MMLRVSASTASRSASSSSASRDVNRSSSAARTVSAWSRIAVTSGAACNAVDLLGEPLDLLADDLADPFGFDHAMGSTTVGPIAQIVEVEDPHVRQLGDRRLDVAGHGDVDDQQRA